MKPNANQTDETKLAVISSAMERMGLDMKEMKDDLKDLKGSYPTKEEVNAKIEALELKHDAAIKSVDTKYELARTLIFGFCAIALIAVIGGLLTLVINK